MANEPAFRAWATGANAPMNCADLRLVDGKSDRETACILTARKVATVTGAPWSPVTVARVRQRLQA